MAVYGEGQAHQQFHHRTFARIISPKDEILHVGNTPEAASDNMLEQ